MDQPSNNQQDNANAQGQPPAKKPFWNRKLMSGGVGTIIALLCITGFTVKTCSRSSGSSDIKSLEAQVKREIEKQFAKDPELKGVRIKSFALIHKSGNDYEGLLEYVENGETESLSVDVTADEKQFIYKIRE